MSVRLVGETRLGKRVVLSVTGALGIALVAGFLVGGIAGDVPLVFAAVCQGANTVCTPPDTTKTSAMTVDHKTTAAYEGGELWVEPDDGETWEITAWWATAPPAECYQRSETAHVTVSWNGSSWATSNVTTTNNIVDISVCQGDECDAGGGSTHSWQYMLIASINDPHQGGGGYNLRDVQYETTSVDDGYTIEGAGSVEDDCYLDASVTPTSQSFSATDDPGLLWLGGRCDYDCDVSGGGSVTIYYE
jgi:hypothetical protein